MYQVSAYIPTFNNDPTIVASIQSLRAQSFPISEIIIVDDGSSDNTIEEAQKDGSIRVIRHRENLGRGAARRTAMEAAENEFVLCCDATNKLKSDFLEKALEWMKIEGVAAVYGWLRDPNPTTAADRWRARHLFSQDEQIEPKERSDLITWGTLVRKSVVLAVGNYDGNLRHSEDAELGDRLKDAGHRIYTDPALEVQPLISNPISKIVERYLRWNFGPNGNDSIISRFKFAKYASSHLVKKDLSLGDFQAAAISIYCILKAFKKYDA